MPEFSCITRIAVTFELCNRFTKCFFSLKLRSICKFLIQNKICARFGGWDIWKTNYGSKVDKFKFTLAGSSTCSLKVASAYPKMILITPNWLKIVNKFHIFFILIILQNMRYFKILRRFGSITSTSHKSPIFCRYLG